MSPRDWQFRIEDILDALERISKYVEGFDYNSWLNDRKTIDAVVRNLEIIGEAATHVPEEVQEKFVNIPWYQMKAMRNVLIHDYFGVDNEVLWKTIRDDLPPLMLELRKLVKNFPYSF